MIKTYLQELVSYLTDPRYYYEAARKSTISRLVFFVMSLGILSISMSIRIQTRVLPELKTTITKLSEELVARYPANYQFNWDGTKLVTLPAQLRLDYPTNIKPAELSLPNQAGVVDTTKNELSEAELASTSAFIAITQQRLYVHQQTGAWQSVSLLDVLGTESRVLSATTIAAFAQEMSQRFISITDSITPALYIVMPSLLILGTLWQHFFDFILILILFQLGTRKQSPGTTLKIILPLIVVVTFLVEVALWLYPTALLTFPLRQTAFWVLFTYIFWFGQPAD